jgi:hypothetical protein
MRRIFCLSLCLLAFASVCPTQKPKTAEDFYNHALPKQAEQDLDGAIKHNPEGALGYFNRAAARQSKSGKW